MNLFQELHKREAFKRDILAAYPDLDETCLKDTLDGASNLEEAMIAVLKSARDDECHIEALETRISELKARANRLQARADKARAMVRAAMEQSDIKRLATAEFTASLRATPRAVIVTDEAVIPSDYWTIPAPRLDKKMIKSALEDGYPVPGCTLSNGGQTLTVHFK